ncbi:hypothetical protein GCM10009664_49870 [Kitasatospora gansuensis]
MPAEPDRHRIVVFGYAGPALDGMVREQYEERAGNGRWSTDEKWHRGPSTSSPDPVATGSTVALGDLLFNRQQT